MKRTIFLLPIILLSCSLYAGHASIGTGDEEDDNLWIWSEPTKNKPAAIQPAETQELPSAFPWSSLWPFTSTFLSQQTKIKEKQD